MATTNITIPARSASGPEGKHAPARMKFYVDTKRCIECGGCEVACKNENNVPSGVARIRVVTVNEGKPGETNVAVPCMHCSNAPCVSVCPVTLCFIGQMALSTSIRIHDRLRLCLMRVHLEHHIS
ncbi:MAG: hypothetical protein CM1200mP30_12270 [Pseudomonadota bacterium]|nr:MAG: hypothetical protein CM1200mP30_12270 [Pseudomonadota bacterium]